MGKLTEKYEANKTKDEFLQVQCVECKRETRHQVAQSFDYSGSEDFDGGQFSIDWVANHQIIQCQGCMTITFRQVNWFSEDAQQIGPDEWDDGSREILFPKRTKYTLPIKNFRDIPPNLRRIYRETIECFNNDAFTLSAAGLRALVEGLCAELKVKDGSKEITKKDGTKETKRFDNLEGKIVGLYEKGYLTQQHSDVLHEHRYLGNEAVHELAQPARGELALAIEIIEHIFDSVYEIPLKALELKVKRTERNKKT
tara:strand:+ start:150 stop:914 length:765 start_codon:yes stop_codon:yes gene_type:complete